MKTSRTFAIFVMAALVGACAFAAASRCFLLAWNEPSGSQPVNWAINFSRTSRSQVRCSCDQSDSNTGNRAF
jgi:hypothetical protein